MSDVRKLQNSGVNLSVDTIPPGFVVKNQEDFKHRLSPLKSFLDTINERGVQIQSNFEVIVHEIEGFQFLCQNISIPHLTTQNADLYYKRYTIQVPIMCEQGHDFEMTVINDASGYIYRTMRYFISGRQYGKDSRQIVPSAYNITVKALSDQMTTFGQDILMKGVRFTNVSGLQFGHSDNNIQTFSVQGYACKVDFIEHLSMKR